MTRKFNQRQLCSELKSTYSSCLLGSLFCSTSSLNSPYLNFTNCKLFLPTTAIELHLPTNLSFVNAFGVDTSYLCSGSLRA